MKRVTLGLGVGQDKNGKNLSYALPELKKKALTMLALEFGGYTATDARGGWIKGCGNTSCLVEEPALSIIVYTAESESFIRMIASRLAVMFNQSSVLLVMEEVPAVEFISQPDIKLVEESKAA